MPTTPPTSQWTQQQKITLRDHIAANTTTVDLGGVPTQIKDVPNTPDTNVVVAEWYNLQASPDFWVFEREVTTEEFIRGIVMSEWLVLGASAPVTALHHNGINLLLKNGVFRPGPLENRNSLVSLFPAGTAPSTRSNLLAILARLATNLEKVFATTATGPAGGDGSTNLNSANITIEGPINLFEITEVRSTVG